MIRVLLVLGLASLCTSYSIVCDPSKPLVVQCRHPCPPERTCQNRNGPEPPCVPPTEPCKETCVCEDGYARNKYGGYCVTFEQCDKCPGNNLYFACDGPYSQNCTGSCYCTDGYECNANGTCVSTDSPTSVNQPPPLQPQTPPTPNKLTCDSETRHEVLGCRFGCPPERTCQNRNGPFPSCAPPPPWLKCTDQCVCADGYIKNGNGDCIPEELCDKCTGQNEYFQCDGVNEPDCEGHCYCFSNHVRDINDKCVYVDPAAPPKIFDPPIETTERPTCPKPEECDTASRHEISACVYGCPPEKSCQNRFWPPPPCAPPGPEIHCTNKCICDDGFFRNEPTGDCVTEEQCDLCPGENEYFKCDGVNEPDCYGHCYCLPNHVRDKDCKCVYVDPAAPPKVVDPPKEPELHCNSANHEVPGCVYPCPPERTCKTLHDPEMPCQPENPHVCKPRCLCGEGYVNNGINGTCITIEQCNKILCPGVGEYFACYGKYIDRCNGRCQCEEGYKRDGNICVKTTSTP
ncbi:zonadhesin-like [Leguminivora glycinivorella]|uniref:zonadhesin-like n=1 Tax=Leguminivora glycinivorella TaxID=1035111 RepID=UPI00200E69C4|nr:zonadhesin-like [Leguminivora glycinivorella]